MARKKKTTAPANPEDHFGDVSALARRDDELLMGDEGPTRADESRRHRLARVGCPVLTCAVLGLDLDVGPRAPEHLAPVRVGKHWVSRPGLQILDLGLSAEQLEHAIEWLRARGA